MSSQRAAVIHAVEHRPAHLGFEDRADAVIELEGVSKSFGSVDALDGIDLVVPRGTVQGLLGPNGAGKTTLVRILATLLAPDAGRVWVAGFDVEQDPHEVRAAIGLAGQYAAVDESLSGRENLVMIGRLYQLGHREARARASEVSSASTWWTPPTGR